jgi:pyridoxine 5-phosphate synthase
MTKLSVNVNKLALIRNSRAKNNPNLEWWGEQILNWGGFGITVHPRPDGRHVRTEDVYKLSAMVQRWNKEHSAHAEFNIEGFPSEEYMQLVLAVKPDQCTLVPDPPEALTSNAGWDFLSERDFLSLTVSKLKEIGTRVSLFLDPATFTQPQQEALRSICTDRVELYTESYADAFGTGGMDEVLQTYGEVSRTLKKMGLAINAGHDLNQQNLGTLVKLIPELKEVSIGHALICEALLEGFPQTICNYLSILNDNDSGK